MNAFPGPSTLEAIGVTKAFRSKIALNNISFFLSPGETLSVVGPSGAGKTTLLRILAGLEKPNEGRIMIGDLDMTDVSPEGRSVGFLFQQYALFPNMSVYDNLAFPLRVRKWSKETTKDHVNYALETINMIEHRFRKPGSLSGGEKQRVALMRAIIFRPSILLLDEPFTALDKILVDQMREELLRIKETYETTMIFVTHDWQFAASISDQMLVLNNGCTEQVAPPKQIFEHPANRFVASFLGATNFIKGEIEQTLGDSKCTVRINTDYITEATLTTEPYGKDVFVSIRPSRIKIMENCDKHLVEGIITTCLYLGSHYMVNVTTSNNLHFWVEVESNNMSNLVKGDKVALTWDSRDAFVVQEQKPI